jgi:hypothetical protein
MDMSNYLFVQKNGIQRIEATLFRTFLVERFFSFLYGFFFYIRAIVGGNIPVRKRRKEHSLSEMSGRAHFNFARSEQSKFQSSWKRSEHIYDVET